MVETKTRTQLRKEARAKRKAGPQAHKPSLGTKREGLVNEINQHFAKFKRLERAMDSASVRISDLGLKLKGITREDLKDQSEENQEIGNAAFDELEELSGAVERMGKQAKESEAARLSALDKLAVVDLKIGTDVASRTAQTSAVKLARGLKRVRQGPLGIKILEGLMKEANKAPEQYRQLAQRMAERMAAETEILHRAIASNDKDAATSASKAIEVLENQRQSFDAIKGLEFSAVVHEAIKDWAAFLLNATLNALVDAGLGRLG